jgi:tagaturonate epimerase
MLTLEKFSLGVGDRFAHQAKAQLRACMMAAERGATIIPVWNKSNREHLIVGSEPDSVRAAADAAVQELGWKLPYHVDADHINLSNVERFIGASDFYTIDVASAIGQPAPAGDVEAFVARHAEITIPRDTFTHIAQKYLSAVQQAGAIYRRIAELRGEREFITEVSMDETDSPQTPPELLVILAAIADEKIPVQTIAPKFTGRFNKGVDYVGDTVQLEKEFTEDIFVIAKAVKQYQLPANLKLSVHSGSDKFSIYAPIRRVLRRTGAGVHVKTAGTTWLEELIGLAESGGEGLEMAKQIYAEAYAHKEELCQPYASVIDIRYGKLPTPETVDNWSAARYTSALRHDPRNAGFSADVRQLLHVGYKVAANMGERYLKMLETCEASISRNVTENLFERHIRPLFLER